MELTGRIESALEQAIEAATRQAPPQLAAALRYSVFPGGARVRPQLCLAVASACGDDAPELADASAAAIELLHCASLVHDDLPCFDDAELRRGKASVHAAFGEAIALLAGDGLIVLAFGLVAQAGLGQPQRLARIIAQLAASAGPDCGLVAGQAWESEPNPPLAHYHCSKTGALFVAAVTCGALAAGADPGPWRALGERLGEAYQVADDLADALACPQECGKPVGQDAAHGRPSAVTALGVAGAAARLERLVEEAAAAVPVYAGAGAMRDLVRQQARRLKPKQLALSLA